MGDKFYFTGDLERAVKDNDVIVANLVERRLEEYFNRDVEMCVVSKAAALSVVTATNTALLQDTDDYDPYDWHSTTSSTHLITPGTAGWYRATASANAVGLVSTTRVRYQMLKVSTTVVKAETDSNTAGGWGQTLSTVLHLGASDYVSANIFHNRGSNLDFFSILSLELIQHT